MSDQGDNQVPDQKSAGAASVDLTGRDRMIGNVLASWSGHLVLIVAGFILPRMIDRRLGQDLLGVWDFAWSLIAYFSLVQAGIGSSVNRYVARYRALGDIDGVNRAVSSVCCFLLGAGAVALGLAVAVSLLLPYLFGSRLTGNLLTAQWLVFILGLGFALQVGFGAFRGVVSGCHRWGLHNAITGGSHAATVACMIVSLCFGGGLISLAIISSVGLVLADLSRVIVAYRVCAGLRVRPSLATWLQTRAMLFFGVKTLIPLTGTLLLYQTINVVIVGTLGLASLALFARPQALIRHLQTLMVKFSHVITPTAGALEGAARIDELGVLLVHSVRYALYMVLPATLVLVVFGDVILGLWMGPRYQSGAVLGILAVGFLPTIAHMPIQSILVGMNAHGRPGIAYLAAALVAAALASIAVGPLGLGLIGVAGAIAIPLALVNGIYLPLYACARLHLPVRRYAARVLPGPALFALPFGVFLFGARALFPDDPYAAAMWSCPLGCLILAGLYGMYVLPERIRTRVCRVMGIEATKT